MQQDSLCYCTEIRVGEGGCMLWARSVVVSWECGLPIKFPGPELQCVDACSWTCILSVSNSTVPTGGDHPSTKALGITPGMSRCCYSTSGNGCFPSRRGCETVHTRGVGQSGNSQLARVELLPRRDVGRDRRKLVELVFTWVPLSITICDHQPSSKLSLNGANGHFISSTVV